MKFLRISREWVFQQPRLVTPSVGTHTGGVFWKRYRFQAFPHFAQTKYRGYVQSQRPPEPLTLIGLDFEGLFRALPL